MRRRFAFSAFIGIFAGIIASTSEPVFAGAFRVTAQVTNGDASLGHFFSVLLQTDGGTKPITWKVISGQLPPGLAIVPLNEPDWPGMSAIQGVPTKTGRYTLTLQGTDTQGATAVGTLTIPGIFSANSDGRGAASAVAVHTKPDGSREWEYVFTQDLPPGRTAAPIDLREGNDQVVLELYGTGIRGRSALSEVKAQIGGVDAEVLSAGPSGAGLDQVDVRVPAALLGRGEVDLLVTVEGRPANTVRVRFN